MRRGPIGSTDPAVLGGERRPTRWLVIPAIAAVAVAAACGGESSGDSTAVVATEPTPSLAGSILPETTPEATGSPESGSEVTETADTINSISNQEVIDLTELNNIEEALAIIDKYWEEMNQLFAGYDFTELGGYSLEDIKAAEYSALKGEDFQPLIAMYGLDLPEYEAMLQAGIDYLSANKKALADVSEEDMVTFRGNGYQSLPSVEDELVRASVFAAQFAYENGIVEALPPSNDLDCPTPTETGIGPDFIVGGQTYAGAFIRRVIFATKEGVQCSTASDAEHDYEAATKYPELYVGVPNIQEIVVSQEEFYDSAWRQYS